MEENGNTPEEKKKYSVVDKRAKYDEETPSVPEEAEPDSVVQVPDSAPAEQPGTEPEAQDRGIRIEDAFVLILNMMRDQALISLGMYYNAPESVAPDVENARRAAELFRALASEHKDIIKSVLPPDQSDMPPLSSDITASLVMALNVLQSQIVVHLGLMADPMTGLVVKDTAQAKKGIDLMTSLSERFKPMLPPEACRDIDTALTNLRLNFINQQKLP